MTRPNIVVICLDDTPWDAWDWMPAMSARTDWVRFPNSRITYPLCGPARSSIWTGQYARNHGVTDHDICSGTIEGGMDPWRFWPVRLRERGYTTGMVGKYNNGYPWDDPGEGGHDKYIPPGWDVWRAVRNGNYFSYSIVEWVLGGTAVRKGYGTAESDYLTDVLTGHANTFVETAKEPFCLYLSHVAPHLDPDTPPPRHATLYDDIDPPHEADWNPADISDKPAWLRAKRPNPLSQAIQDELDLEHRITYQMLKAVDEGLEAMFTALATRGVLDNTVVIFLGDNSNLYGEHRWNKKWVPYDKCLDAQMAVRWPGVAGGTNPAILSNIDLAPTLCDIAGTRMPVASDGMSFKPLMEGATSSWRRDLLIEQYESGSTRGNPWQGVVSLDERKYVVHEAGDIEAYDMAADPLELSNLAADPGGMARRLSRLQTG